MAEDPNVVEGAGEVAMVLVFFLVVGLISIPFLLDMCRESRADSLRLSGTPAKAEVLEAEQTGSYVNANPEVRIRLRIMASEGGSYEATDVEYVNQVDLPKLQPGAVISVRVDPKDPKRVAVVWNER